MKCLSCTDSPLPSPLPPPPLTLTLALLRPCKTLMYAVVKRCCTRLLVSKGGAHRGCAPRTRREKERGGGGRKKKNDAYILLYKYSSFFSPPPSPLPRKANFSTSTGCWSVQLNFIKKRRTLGGTTKGGVKSGGEQAL